MPRKLVRQSCPAKGTETTWQGAGSHTTPTRPVAWCGRSSLGGFDAPSVLVESLQPAGVLRRAALTGPQFRAERALLALQVNGADLSMDHGFPARIIVPALPGVHNTKWVGRMTWAGAPRGGGRA